MGRNLQNGSRVVNSIYLIIVFLLNVITWLMNEVLNDLVIVVTVDVNNKYEE
jgi:hypothetical protein